MQRYILTYRTASGALMRLTGLGREACDQIEHAQSALGSSDFDRTAEPQHAPGPWSVTTLGGVAAYVNAADGPIARLGDTGRAGFRRDGNARLIAAAPAMYALLQDVARTINNPDADDYFDASRIEAAIAEIIAAVEGREVQS